jgi:DNA-binding protein H-NS
MDLKSMSRVELENLMKEVQRAIKDAEVRDRQAAIEAAKKAAAEYGFSLSELAGDKSDSGKSRGKGGTKSAPKYANPADKSQTWTGKGRQPNWYRLEIEKGTDPDSMKI